uniref:Uncharacterized protein n=1 Tax=Candidatus Kentrum sp. DK TaxID=2126562 RepID=A0A450S3J3_9GAMM|nr:MAG: hypothetical protein BECKDK2373C_GA0170839_101440 [Candidatus Kentron sp. DK]
MPATTSRKPAFTSSIPYCAPKGYGDHLRLRLETPPPVDLTGTRGRRRKGPGRVDYLLCVQIWRHAKMEPIMPSATPGSTSLSGFGPRSTRTIRTTPKPIPITDNPGPLAGSVRSCSTPAMAVPLHQRSAGISKGTRENAIEGLFGYLVTVRSAAETVESVPVFRKFPLRSSLCFFRDCARKKRHPDGAQQKRTPGNTQGLWPV